MHSLGSDSFSSKRSPKAWHELGGTPEQTVAPRHVATRALKSALSSSYSKALPSRLSESICSRCSCCHGSGGTPLSPFRATSSTRSRSNVAPEVALPNSSGSEPIRPLSSRSMATTTQRASSYAATPVLLPLAQPAGKI